MKRRFRCIPQHAMRASIGATNSSIYVTLTYNAASLKRGERIKSDGMAATLLSSVQQHRHELRDALLHLEGRQQMELFLYFDGDISAPLLPAKPRACLILPSVLPSHG